MTLERQDFTIYEGEDKTVRISVTDTENGTPVALTGATGVAWRVSDGTSFVFEKTLGSGISLADDAGTDDQIVITLNGADTTDAGHIVYSHECRVTDAAGKSHVVAVGTFVVKASTTG